MRLLKPTRLVSWAPILVIKLGSPSPLQDVGGCALFQVTEGSGDRGVRLSFKLERPKG